MDAHKIEEQRVMRMMVKGGVDLNRMSGQEKYGAYIFYTNLRTSSGIDFDNEFMKYVNTLRESQRSVSLKESGNTGIL